MVSTKLEVVILAPDVGIDQCIKRRDCRISNWPNCRITKYPLEELTQVHHACPKGRGSRASVQIGHEHLGRRLVSKAFARLIVEMLRKRGQVAL